MIVPALVLAAAVAPPAVHVTYRASYPASLYWVVNALAGDQHTDTETYRADWRAHGPAQPDDVAALREFDRLRRRYHGSLPEATPRENGWIPVPPPASNQVDKRFANCFLAADTMAEAWARVDGLLAEEDAAALRRVMAHFEPRFERRWRTWSYLGAYRTAFERFGKEGLDAWLGRASRFYGVPADERLAPRVTFVYTPPSRRTHGRAIGGNLVVEVVPGEKPADRADVVAHELSHYFYQRAGVPDDPALIDAIYRTAGADAGPLLGLINEGVATAVGQGVVAEALRPAQFARERAKPLGWYNDALVDTYAKALFPAVKAAFQAGTTLRDLAPALAASYRQAFGAAPRTPRRTLLSYMLVMDDFQHARYARYFDQVPMRSLYNRSLEEGGTFWTRHRGLPALVTLTRKQAAAMPALAASYGLTPGEAAVLTPAAPGVLYKPRPTGGDLFVVTAADEEALAEVLARFGGLERLEPGWTPLP